MKDYTNPYFIIMETDAKADAAKLGVVLFVSAGADDSDTTTQNVSIDNAIADGDQGIIITPNGDAVDPSIALARRHGIYVIALDSVPSPASVVNITYATDNYGAGVLLGEYSAKRFDGKSADIALLDDVTTEVVPIDVQRDHGFLAGMGIPVGKPDINGYEPKSGTYKGKKGGSGTYNIACQEPTNGSVSGGLSAMETCLSKDPKINLVYAVNELAAEGAWTATKNAHKSRVTIVMIDGGCAQTPWLKSGELTAGATQFPGKMASDGVTAIYTLVRTGKPPKAAAGQDFINTGTELFTDSPVPGVPSLNTTQDANICW